MHGRDQGGRTVLLPIGKKYWGGSVKEPRIERKIGKQKKNEVMGTVFGGSHREGVRKNWVKVG